MRIAANTTITETPKASKEIKDKKNIPAETPKGPAVSKTSVDISVTARMTAQLNGLKEALHNIDRGRAFVKTADSYIEDTERIIQRIRQLAVKSANGTYTNRDRQIIQVEVSAMVDEVDRIASQAEFNRFKVLTGEFSRINGMSSMWIQVGPNHHQRERIFISTMTGQALMLKDSSGRISISLSTPAGGNRAIGMMDNALSVIAKQRGDLGAYNERLKLAAEGTANKIELILKTEDVKVDQKEMLDILKTIRKRNGIK